MINHNPRILVKVIYFLFFGLVIVFSMLAQSPKEPIKSSFHKPLNKTETKICVKPKKQRPSKPAMKKTLTNNKTTESPKTITENSDIPSITEAKRACIFTGNLLDLPKGKVVQQEQPKPGEPKTKPKVLKNQPIELA